MQAEANRLDPTAVLKVWYERDADADAHAKLWAQIQSGWDDVAKCQDAARLIPLDAPVGISRYDLTSPVTVDKVYDLLGESLTSV